MPRTLPPQRDPVLDDLDMEKEPAETWLERTQGFILPVFGVLAALLGPWLLVGLLWVILYLFNLYYGPSS